MSGSEIKEVQKKDAPKSPVAIVGIGASAGGLEALEQFFSEMNPVSGFAFVIIQHLSPHFKSLMDEILARHTSMAIKVVEDETKVEANVVYLIPPNNEMIISDGKLYLSEKESSSALSLPVDTFFNSLARDQGPRAVGIILSGTGSDGSRGINEISKYGGLVFVQEPSTAKFDGMPNMAVETGVVNQVSSPKEIPDLLEKLISKNINGQELCLDSSFGYMQELKDIFTLLLHAYDIDFSFYKPSTIIRRLERRIALKNFNSIEEYLTLLNSDIYELDALYHDLLIEVTEFFRDIEAFKAIEEEVIPKLFNNPKCNGEIRVWVSACATGEEAYSIAILIDEYIRENNLNRDFKIFATDIHKESLNKAGRGIYCENAVTKISPERLERYFQRKGIYYQVNTSLRQKIVFAPHNLVNDPPFTRMDLITNRNFLIYLKSAVQKKVISMLHFGLKSEGYLFLGSSEHLGDLEKDFESINPKWKIFKKTHDIRFPINLRLPNPSMLETNSALPSAKINVPSFPVNYRGSERDLFSLYDSLLGIYIQDSFIVNSREELIHTFGDADKYLQVVKGRVSLELPNLVLDDLKAPISAVLQRAYSEKKTIRYTDVNLNLPDSKQEDLTITVEPLPVYDNGERFFIVTIESKEIFEAKADDQESVNYKTISKDELNSLRNELAYTKEYLQTTIEELETSNEELQAANEELQASNEELQSTNEELHSTNEELYTVNSEYQNKIEELIQLNDDITNLLNSTKVGTIFLDETLNVRKFTPSVTDLFNLLPQDIGRPIFHIAHNVEDQNLLQNLDVVLESGQMIEEEVRKNDGTWFLMRALPYISNLNSVEGVTVTFININQLKLAQEELVESEKRLRFIMETVNDGYWDWEIEKDTEYISPKFKEMFGYQDHELENSPESWKSLIYPEDLDLSIKNAEKHIQTDGEFPYIQEVRYKHRDDSTVWVICRGVGLKNSEGKINRIVGTHTDITELKKTQEMLLESNTELQQFAHMASHDMQAPLRHIRSYLNLFLDTYKDKVDQQGEVWAGYIDAGAERMQKQIKSLLYFSKIGKQNVEVQDLDLNDSVNCIVEMLSESIKEVEASVAFDKLPVIKANKVYIEKIIQNLFENAIKFRSSERKLEIVIDVIEDEQEWKVSFKDNGIGIEPKYKDRIFQIFQRLNSTSKYEGNGIGLSICKKIVNHHGGDIWVESELDKGATFYFTIPKDYVHKVLES